MNIFKKSFAFMACIAFSVMLSLSVYAADTNYRYLVINGKNAAVDSGGRPVNIDGTVYVPLRSVFDALNDGSGSMDWDNENNVEILTLKGVSMKLWLNSPQAEVNGVQADIPGGASPRMVNDRVYAPLNFIADKLNMVSGYSDLYSTVSIVDKDDYSQINELLSNNGAGSSKVSMNVSLSAAETIDVPQDGAGFDTNADPDVSYSYEMVGDSMEISGLVQMDTGEEFAHMVLTGIYPGQESASVEYYILGDVMFINDGISGWQVTSSADSPLDMTLLDPSPDAVMGPAGIAEAMGDENSFDPLLFFGLSKDDNGDLCVFGVISDPSGETGIYEDGDVPASERMSLKYVFDKDTKILKAAKMGLDITLFGDGMGKYSLSMNYSFDNIDVSPDFESAVPDAVVNNAREMDNSFENQALAHREKF